MTTARPVNTGSYRLVRLGDAALYQTSINDYDLIVLDVLPKQSDGFQVCSELRARGDSTPILMLTARATIDDRITGFDAGADDYLAKPFSFREFLATIRAEQETVPTNSDRTAND